MDDKRIRLGENSYGSKAALPIFAKTMNKIYNLDSYYIDDNKYELDPYNDSWDNIPDGVSKIEVCVDNNNLCKSDKYCRNSYEELFLNGFEPPECGEFRVINPD